ncbi:MAG: cupin domain-containing protein [Helicobacter sp.]|nr:cupin domain-containing protein [Helicobacteraceae bacterium]MDY3112768.1 cupin domain-containing protein [Helicobacter sp.]
MKPLKKMCVFHNQNLLEAIAQIEKNKEKAVFVVDKSYKFLGIITDGDIRRYILKTRDFQLDTKTSEILKPNYKAIYQNEVNHKNLLEAFSSDKFEIIPILDAKNKLVSYITKHSFYQNLLLNKPLTSINHKKELEISARPWGFYKSTLLTKFVQSKIITILPKQSISLQKHLRREEHWIIIFGKGKIILENSSLKVHTGKYFYIPKGCKHRLINTSKSQNLIFCEVQLGDYFGEDDIIRYEDQYERI